MPSVLLGSQALVHTLKPFKICNSEVIFRYILLAPDFHHPRLAAAFCYILLSSSAFFTPFIICNNPKIRQGVLPYFSCILCLLSSPAYQYNDQADDQDHQCHTSSGDHILFRSRFPGIFLLAERPCCFCFLHEIRPDALCA